MVTTIQITIISLLSVFVEPPGRNRMELALCGVARRIKHGNIGSFDPLAGPLPGLLQAIFI